MKSELSLERRIIRYGLIIDFQKLQKEFVFMNMGLLKSLYMTLRCH